jgi:hypothetical protein
MGAPERVYDLLPLSSGKVPVFYDHSIHWKYHVVPSMPIKTVVTSPAVVPDDNRWFVRTLHYYIEKIHYPDYMENDVRPQTR